MGRLDLRDVYRDEDWTPQRYVQEGIPDKLLHNLAHAPVVPEEQIDYVPHGGRRQVARYPHQERKAA